MTGDYPYDRTTEEGAGVLQRIALNWFLVQSNKLLALW